VGAPVGPSVGGNVGSGVGASGVGIVGSCDGGRVGLEVNMGGSLGDVEGEIVFE
jgi:hypothetical protein